jgi:DNA polymerase-4
VGPVTAAKLRERGITNVGDVARLPEASLVAILGRAAGRQVHALARNRDPRRVRGGRRRRSIGAQRALGRMPRTWEALDAVLVGLVDRVARRLRAGRRACRTVVLRLRFGDFSRAARSHTLAQATARTHTLLSTARALLATAMPLVERQGITLLGVALSNLEDANAVQLALPFAGGEAAELDAALDGIRDRFGSSAITRAVLVGRDQGLSVPLLPD